MSDNILDLNPKLEKNNAPDDDQVYTDYEGLDWFHFPCEYEIGGKKFCFDLWALSEEDAEAHMQAIKDNGEVIGKMVAEEDWDDNDV